MDRPGARALNGGMTTLRGTMLVLATLSMGMMAGVFALYSHAIMPGLGRTDDRTFVGAFQSVDRAIVNPWFMLTFIGALAFTAAAALLHIGRAALPWILVAVVLYLVAFAVTIGVHVPMNDALKAAGDPDRIGDLAAVRSRFDEGRWATWNLVRTLTSTVAAGSLAVALLQR